MPIEIVYFNTAENEWLNKRLSESGDVTSSSGEDRRSFLTALSQAVERCDTIVTVGQISSLVTVLAKGLGLPLVPVDWSALGLSGEDGAVLPQGALPLIVDGSVYGMIIESASQCIIAIDDDENAVKHLTDTYILTYIGAVSAPADTEATGEPAAPQQPEPEQPSVTEQIQPVEYIDDTPSEQPEPDIFADIDDDEFLGFEKEKRHRGWLIALICIILTVVIGVSGGFVGYKYWYIPKQYNDSVLKARDQYSNPTTDTVKGFPSDYSLKFTSLYSANKDVIGWIRIKDLDIDLPIVTGHDKTFGYYDLHLFDGTVSKFGTPHIYYAYDTVSNINTNLIVYGNNTGDGRAFSNIEKMLSASVASKTEIMTDSVFYGEDKWEIFSVMLLNANGDEYDYNNNYRTLSAEQRSTMLKGAVQRSNINLGKSESDFDNVSLNDTFLTLVTPYSKDSDKVIVVMASRVASQGEDTPDIEQEEDADIIGSESDATESSTEG